MARTVSWTECALRDLDDAAQFIAHDSKFYAKAFVREVRLAARSLRHFAERGRVVPEIGDFDIRELFVRRYRLIYTLEGKHKVLVVRFIHGSRDLSRLLDDQA